MKSLDGRYLQDESQEQGDICDSITIAFVELGWALSSPCYGPLLYGIALLIKGLGEGRIDPEWRLNEGIHNLYQNIIAILSAILAASLHVAKLCDLML